MSDKAHEHLMKLLREPISRDKGVIPIEDRETALHWEIVNSEWPEIVAEANKWLH